ncbi:hypothetical protein U1Q18_039386 [Sarracenia purpurea var. burkii]
MEDSGADAPSRLSNPHPRQHPQPGTSLASSGDNAAASPSTSAPSLVLSGHQRLLPAMAYHSFTTVSAVLNLLRHRHRAKPTNVYQSSHQEPPMHRW